MTHVTSHMSYVACHMSATAMVTSTNPLPANPPTMHSRVVPKDIFFICFGEPAYFNCHTQKPNNFKTQKATKRLKNVKFYIFYMLIYLKKGFLVLQF